MKKKNFNVKRYNKIRPKDELVTLYLNDIKGQKSKPITTEEEKALLEKYYDEKTTKEDKIAIKKKIVMSHQRFLYDMANCYANGDNNLLLELIDVGTMGMYETFDNFEIEKDNKFLTLAQYYVRRAIKHFLEDENLLVRPTNNAKLTPKIKKIEEEFMRTEGRKPNVFEVEDLLYEKYGVELADRSDLYGVTIERVDDSADGSEDDDYTFGNSKGFNDYAATENDFEVDTRKKDAAFVVKKLLEKLPERERIIIEMAWGLGDYMKPSNNEEIGDVLHLTSERVRQLKQHAMKKMKNYMQNVEV